MRRVPVLAFLIFSLPQLLGAQAKDDTQERLRALEEKVRELEAELQALKAAPPAAAPPATQAAVPTPTEAAATAPPSPAGGGPTAPALVQLPAGAPLTPSGPLPVYGGASAAAKVLNPDISVIGDFIGVGGRNTVQPLPALEMHESEVGLQAIIDPYARGDFFLTFGEQGVGLEEGYITFTSLPGGFVAKVGKMRSSFGVVNTLHNHVLPWIDRPLVTDNLVAGEDGIDDAGVSINRILPAPKGIFLEATGQVFRGDSGDVFSHTRRSDLSAVGRLRAYRDLTESTNLDLGLSVARGHNDLGSAYRTELYDLDATLRWKPLRRAIYHNFLTRTELIWSEREQPSSVQRAFGFYTASDYRLNRRWTVGGRYDRSERARNAALTDSGFSAVLTYWPSEFSQVRGQYRFTRYAGGRDANELLFQFIFVLGAHGAHPF
jgi:hypothetical protein